MFWRQTNTLIFFTSLSFFRDVSPPWLPFLVWTLSPWNAWLFEPITNLSYCSWLETSEKELDRDFGKRARELWSCQAVPLDPIRTQRERNTFNQRAFAHTLPCFPCPVFWIRWVLYQCQFLSLWFVGEVQRNRLIFGCSITQWNVLIASLRNSLYYEETGQGWSPEKSKPAQILWGNSAHETGLRNHWAQEVIFVVLASLPLFFGGICVWCSLPRKPVLETQNPMVKLFDKVPKLWAMDNFNTDLKFSSCSASDT